MTNEEILECVHKALERGCEQMLINTPTEKQIISKFTYEALKEYFEDITITRNPYFNTITVNGSKIYFSKDEYRVDYYANHAGCEYDYILDGFDYDCDGEYSYRRDWFMSRLRYKGSVQLVYETEHLITYIKN